MAKNKRPKRNGNERFVWKRVWVEDEGGGGEDYRRNLNPICSSFTNGMKMYWQQKPMAGPTGRFRAATTTPRSSVQPMLTKETDTRMATVAMKTTSTKFLARTTARRRADGAAASTRRDALTDWSGHKRTSSRVRPRKRPVTFTVAVQLASGSSFDT